MDAKQLLVVAVGIAAWYTRPVVSHSYENSFTNVKAMC